MESSKRAELREELKENNKLFEVLTKQFLVNRAKLDSIKETQKALIDEGDDIIAKQDKIIARNDEILKELWGD